jgi:hypothetical protein
VSSLPFAQDPREPPMSFVVAKSNGKDLLDKMSGIL